MKTSLVILLLLFACSLKAPPLPPPPNRAAGGSTNPGLYFTNANSGVIRAPSPVPPMPDFRRPTARDFGITNLVVHTNTLAQLAIDPAKQAAIRRDSIGLFIVAGLIMFYVVWAGCRGSVFMCNRQFVGFIDRQKDPVGFWIVMVVDFGAALALIYLAIHEWRMLP